MDPTAAAQAVTGAPLRTAHRWKVLAAGVLANMAFTFTIGGIPAASLFIRDQYATSTLLVGLLMGMMGLGIALSEIPWGMATDRYGDRPVLLLGLGGAALVLAVIALATQASPGPGHFGGLMAGLLLTGLVGSSVNGSSGRAIMSWFATRERGLAMSIRQTAVPMGYGLGAVVYPYLASHFGLASAYGVSALACVVAAILAFAWIVEPAQETAKAQAGVTSVAQSPLRLWKVWRIVLAIGVLCAPQFAIMTFSMIFLHDQLGLSVGTISAVLFVIQMSSIVTRISSGRLTDKHQNRRIYLKTCSLLCVAAFALLALCTTLNASLAASLHWLPVACLLLAGVLVSAWHGVGYTELATEAGSSKVATALAMGNAAVFLILFITPSSVPVIAHAVSWGGTWAVMALLCLLSYALFPNPLMKK